MTLAGVENGGECYCGNKLNVASPPVSSGCSKGCSSGVPEDGHCGGFWAIEVFPVNCTGAPEPKPAEAPELVNPCRDPTGPYASQPWCDATLALEARVDDAVSRLTLDEKISAMGTGTGALPSLGLPAYNWWSEASSGIATGRHTQTTKFAFPITTGMSFNRTMWQLTGRQIAMEGRAMMNAGNGYSTFWAPVINLAREPRWGRNIETPGEDPILTGEYANYFVRGFQEAPQDPNHLLASACCKHYAANSMESTTEADGEHHDRNHVDSEVSMQDLMDSYMKPFQACVEKGRVSSLMCSYNAINGVPSCANDWLLQTVARDNWEFDGYITSDCDADADVYNSHHYTSTPEEAVRDVLHAGTDIDCGGFVQQHARSALNMSMITEADMDERLKMQFKVRFRLNHFDPVGPLDKIQQNDTICSDYSLALSHDGVTQSAVLLKNDGDTLPLTKGKKQTIAVIGPNARLSESTAGYYGPHNVCDGKFWTLVDALQYDSAKTVTDIAGVPNVLSGDTSGIPAAVDMAKTADVVVLAVGTDLSWSAEGHDAKTIDFTEAQLTLIEQVSAAAKNPVIVTLFTATPLDLTTLLSNDKIGAILHVGQPSVTILGAGPLFYGDRSPAGRMVQTVYPSDYQHQISIFDFGMRPGASPFARPDCTLNPSTHCPKGTNPGRTYRFYTGKPVVEFGFGLSYTTFHYSQSAGQLTTKLDLSPLRAGLKRSQKLGHSFLKLEHAELLREKAGWTSREEWGLLGSQFAVNVTNTGDMAADEVVLGFMKPPGAGENGVALKSLFGFQRIHLAAGETKEVFLYPALGDFIRIDESGLQVAFPGEYKIEFGVQGAAFLEAGVVNAI